MTKSYKSISVLRLFSTLTIFAFHYLLSYTEFGKKYFPLYFVVQVFLFISGFLYGGKKPKSIKGFYIKNFAKILTPALVTVVVFGVAYLVFYLCGNLLPLSKPGQNGTTLVMIGHFWFIYAILLCYLITPALHTIYDFHAYGQGNKKRVSLLEVVIAIIIIANFFVSTLGEQLMVISYVVGFLFRKFKDFTRFNDSKIALVTISVISFLAAAVGCYLLSGHAYTHLFSLMREIFCVVLGVSLTVLVLSLTNATAGKANFVLKFSDKYSYTFFLTHQFFLVAGFATLIDTLPTWLFIIVALLFTILTAVIVDIISASIIKAITSPRKKEQPLEEKQDKAA